MARTFGRLLVKTLKDIDKAQQRAAREREREERKALAAQARYERDLEREEERRLKAERKEQVAQERERVRLEKESRKSAQERLRAQLAREKAMQKSAIDAGKHALHARVKEREALCQRFIDSTIE